MNESIAEIRKSLCVANVRNGILPKNSNWFWIQAEFFRSTLSKVSRNYAERIDVNRTPWKDSSLLSKQIAVYLRFQCQSNAIRRVRWQCSNSFKNRTSILVRRAASWSGRWSTLDPTLYKSLQDTRSNPLRFRWMLIRSDSIEFVCQIQSD